MTRLLVVRHARAAAPDDLRLPGRDLPLLTEGLRQAAALAERLAPLRPATVWASDARRARETAEIVAARCGAPFGLRSGLREMDFGDWAGRTYAEVTALDPAAADWFADPTIGAPPGGEHPADAALRVLAALGDLDTGENGPVVVVGHAGSLRLALASALGMPLTAAWRLRLDCAGLTVLDWTEAGPVVERLNDAGHLRGWAGAAESGDGQAINDRADEESTPKGAKIAVHNSTGPRQPVIPSSSRDLVFQSRNRGVGESRSDEIPRRARDDGARGSEARSSQGGSGGATGDSGIEGNRAGGDSPVPKAPVAPAVRHDEGGGERAGGPAITLILGGARSGKSTLAERLAAESGRPVVYLATSVPFDAEMRERIAVHRADRPAGWHTVEEPLQIAAAVREQARPGDLVLIDCLTVWLSNLLLDGVGMDRDPDAVPADSWNALEAAALAEIDALLNDARARGIALVLVSNEVGMGVVPAYPLGRRYRDALGRVNQCLAARAGEALLTVAGLAIDLRRIERPATSV